MGSVGYAKSVCPISPAFCREVSMQALKLLAACALCLLVIVALAWLVQWLS